MKKNVPKKVSNLCDKVWIAKIDQEDEIKLYVMAQDKVKDPGEAVVKVKNFETTAPTMKTAPIMSKQHT